MNVTCTIITADYLHYALALNESLLKFQNVKFYVLVVDEKIDESTIKNMFPNIHFLYLDDINTTEIAREIIAKYQMANEDALRWSLKSVLINYLLNNHTKVLCLDCDLYFYNNYQFLFDELEDNNLIITPHWRSSNPYVANRNFESLFNEGLYNAGFIGANQDAKEIMLWWAMCCNYKCEINTQKGHYVDQTYLNLMPIYFEKVKILRHRGCNISEWNREECSRTTMPSGVILINNKYPIVFIHFVKYLISDIKDKKDTLLTNHLELFESSVKSYRILSEPYRIKKISSTENNSLHDTREKDKNILKKLKHKLRIRTRVKLFLKG